MNKEDRPQLDFIFKCIEGELDYQADEGYAEEDASETEFLVYIQDYVRQAMTQATRYATGEEYAQVRHSIRKIAALAVACMMENGCYARPGYKGSGALKTKDPEVCTCTCAQCKCEKCNGYFCNC